MKRKVGATEPIPTHNRVLLLKLTSDRKLSVETQGEIAKIIKMTRETRGHEAAEKKAEELTEIINAHDTEEEILEAIRKML